MNVLGPTLNTNFNEHECFTEVYTHVCTAALKQARASSVLLRIVPLYSTHDLACAEVENALCLKVGRCCFVRGVEGHAQTYSCDNLPVERPQFHETCCYSVRAAFTTHGFAVNCIKIVIFSRDCVSSTSTVRDICVVIATKFSLCWFYSYRYNWTLHYTQQI